MKNNSNQHVHVNVYAMGEDLERRLFALGFFADHFVHIGKGQYMPPYNYSFETRNDSKQMNSVFERTVPVLSEDSEFRGYIESEVIPDSYCFPSDATRLEDPSALLFPFAPCVREEVAPSHRKICDIHIERSVDSPWDALDDTLLKHGFYDGYTATERLFTLHFSSCADGKKAYHLLQEYLASLRGVKKMYLEITQNLWRKPSDFPVPVVVKKGGIIPYSSR